MLEALAKNPKFQSRKGPVVLVIMDGVGIGKYAEGDAVLDSNTPFLHHMMNTLPMTTLKAHGTAVGLPSDADMGNSEVGHNAMGCGRVFAQGAKLVSQAIETGRMFEGETWKELISHVNGKNSTLHFLGLFSDGNVHSHIDHLKGMLVKALAEGVKKIRLHILLDGRDVPETSALDYIDPFETWLAEQAAAAGADCRIASGGGRMVITMDRYGANWDMVRKGWETHVAGKGRYFKTAHEAVETLRAETKAIDQDLPPFVISDDGATPVGAIQDGDAVVYFNFRGDRALEISQAFEDPAFDKFERTPCPNVYYAGMMEYDGDLHIPNHYLVNPPEIDRTLGEYLAATGVTQLAISETQKFGHVTYFFNGNRSGMFDPNTEKYVEVPSDVVPFEQRPWMQCALITDQVCDAIAEGKYQFIRLNFPNGDMVGHTGVYQAVQTSMAALDICLERLYNAVEKAGGVMIMTADHGNADDMYEHDKTGAVKLDKKTGAPKRKTSHSLNPVPAIIFDPAYANEYSTTLKAGLGISSIPATVINFLGYVPPADYDPSIVEMN
ncbi:MAG: 2,3-bisphosphoglycerate-independent phosphoglycerate mutase [Lentisphaeria bacterium]|nr:2,3-bisphosphoglycerate-independent phosphoglycerate mutase [Lentisphaeria bacterium]